MYVYLRIVTRAAYSIYEQTNRLDEAETQQRAVLEKQRLVLGASDLETIASTFMLANVLLRARKGEATA